MTFYHACQLWNVYRLVSTTFAGSVPSCLRPGNTSERLIDDMQSEGTFASDRCRNSSPGRPRICPLLEYLYVYAIGWEGHRLGDVAGFLVSCCSPSDHHFCSSTPQSSGINSPILKEAHIEWCDFTEEKFLQYPGIDKCLNNGLNVSFQRTALELSYSADCEFLQ